MENPGLHEAHCGEEGREAAGRCPSSQGQWNESEEDGPKADLDEEYPSLKKVGVARYQQLLANKFTADFEGKFVVYRKLFSTKQGREQNRTMYEAWIQALGRVKRTSTPRAIMKCTANKMRSKKKGPFRGGYSRGS